MHIGWAFRYHCKFSVKYLNKLRKILIAFLNSINPFKPHFFNKPVLQCLVYPLYPALSFSAFRKNTAYAEFRHGPAELGKPVAIAGICRFTFSGIDSEYSVLINIKRYRSAVFFKITADRSKICGCTLAFRKLKMQELARGVINKNQKCTFGRTSFKPVMR